MRSLVLVLFGLSSATKIADLRRDIEQRVDRGSPKRLSKAALRPRLKVVMRLVHRCYEKAVASDPTIRGVVNIALTVRNDPTLGISLTVTGFDTDGPLGDSRPFLTCAKTALESRVLPPLPALGRLETLYPLTFDPGGGNHPDDAAIVDDAVQAAKQGRCAEALDGAARGLTRTWMTRPFRHTLLEVAGTCACRLKDEAKARHYFALASPEFEDAILHACTAAGIQLE